MTVYVHNVCEYQMDRSSPDAPRLEVHYNQLANFGDFRFMNAAQRPATPASASPQSLPQSASNAYQPKRKPYSGARQAIAFESSVKLTVNLLLAIVATTTIAKLVPYYQSQQSRLDTLQVAVANAESRNAELRSRFSRNFDPAQASRIMQEQSGMGYPNQKTIIWTEPATSNAATDAALENAAQ